MDIQKKRSERIDQWRSFKDFFAKLIIAMGGIFIIIAVVLIFIYLLSVVFPLFTAPEIKTEQTDTIIQTPLYTAIDEYQETATAVYQKQVHHLNLFEFTSATQTQEIPAPITAFSQVSIKPVAFVWGASDGSVSLMQHRFNLSYNQNNQRTVTPETRYLFEADNSVFALSNTPIHAVAARADEDKIVIAFYSNKQLSVIFYEKSTSLLDDSVSLAEDLRFNLPTESLALSDDSAPLIYLSNDARWLLAVTDHRLTAYPIYDTERAQHPQTLRFTNRITASAWLLGETSLLLGDETGQITKVFSIREQWQTIESLKAFDSPVTRMVSEHQRKVFAAHNAEGHIQLIYAPSFSKIIEHDHKETITGLEFSPRGNGLMIHSSNHRTLLSITNEHPEVNWKSLWRKVHYEGYDEPRYIWQSSASNQDFEAKLSLTPLTFGTLKAAFYAMIMAMPLAIMGAIFTAFFMSPQMRRIVKPSIEIMEALPTVILGFLAGLWLSPFIEQNLTAIFLTLWVVPFGVMLFGWLTFKAPEKWKPLFSEQWRAALIIPVIILLTVASFGLATPVEWLFFNGDFRQYLSQEMGVNYDQRNALVVGFAMGFAVIPTIFSITEDAVFSVPKHLVNGSLALGASSWQTLVGVVIPTASPGIFSGVMIGFGRAVGETMIVLMATGNTPIMDWNIFEGMRTLAANIAVEMPESEVGSSHYRILFLAALVLFLFTFVFNTAAEIIRQRLRKKYGSL